VFFIRPTAPFTGQGTHESPDGSVFEGTAKDWALACKGEFTNSNGDKYVGDFKEGYLDGEGEYIATDGDSYKGA
jgi:hypothetical protein